MIYRPATLADAPALAALGAETFIAAFGHLYTEADLTAFLAQVHAPGPVAGEIAGDECTHCLVEDDAGTLVAYCKLRYPSHYTHLSDARDPLELGQLYALPTHTGAGIGAQRFYQRYGFGKIADITFPVGEQLDEEFLYELKL